MIKVGDKTLYDAVDVKKMYDELTPWDKTRFALAIHDCDADEQIKLQNGWIDENDALDYVVENERISEILWHFDDYAILDEVDSDSIMHFILENENQFTLDEILEGWENTVAFYSTRDKHMPFSNKTVTSLRALADRMENTLKSKQDKA